MIDKIYNDCLNDISIKKIYDEIGIVEDEKGGWAYHNYDHVMSVTNIVTSILTSLDYDKEFIAKAKIACLFHDVGALEGKDNHADRSYLFAKKYFLDHNISFDGIDDVLEAIKIHSEGFDTDNIIALSLILSDKLDIKQTRVAKEGKHIEGNRQYLHITDIIIKIEDKKLSVNFITDGKMDLEEFNEYYFTKKVFKSIASFAKRLALEYSVYIDNENV